MATSTLPHSTDLARFVNRYIPHHYPWLSKTLDSIELQEDILSGGKKITLKYKNGKYEMHRIVATSNPNDYANNIKLVLYAKELELMPKRGGRASSLHI